VRGTIITIIAIVLILIAFFLLDALLGQIRGAFGLN
jgi:preprotein translocase subunit SecE